MCHGGRARHRHPTATLLVCADAVQCRVVEPDPGGGAWHRLFVQRLCQGEPSVSWLDKFPLLVLVALAAWMAVAPLTPEPHLIEKLRMLSQGSLTKPLDMFDLCLHTAPLVLLTVRLWRQFNSR